MLFGSTEPSFPSGPVLRLSERAIMQVARSCVALMQGEGETAGQASPIAYAATMALYDDVLGARLEPTDHESRATVAAAAFIRGHLDRDLSVPVLARITGLSRAHFTRVFAAHLGSSPGNMCWSSAGGTPHGFSRAAISRSRLSRSRAGSATANYFAKGFRRTFGVSPTEFRTTGMYATRR
jgi:AraC-like DNA-binding protein